MRVLVVEDDAEMAEALVAMLRSESYAVDHAGDGPTAAACVESWAYDLIVLDWTIPPPSGPDLLRHWRRRGVSSPVLLLTGHRTVAERVEGLDYGADDYLTKPFAFAELLARVRALLRRRERPLADQLVAGDLEVDRSSREVRLSGRLLHLAPKEYSLLEYLMLRPDRVVSRAELAAHVWDEEFDASSNVIDVLVYRLRKKIDGDRSDRLLQTRHGAGYTIASRRL